MTNMRNHSGKAEISKYPGNGSESANGCTAQKCDYVTLVQTDEQGSKGERKHLSTDDLRHTNAKVAENLGQWADLAFNYK